METHALSRARWWFVFSGISRRARTRAALPSDTAVVVTEDRYLAEWRRMAWTVQDENDASADDYSYLLYCRTRVETVLRSTEEPLRSQLVEAVRSTDGRFRELTEEDPDELLGHFVNLSRAEGWWYRRIPKKGPIRRQLDGVPHRERPA